MKKLTLFLTSLLLLASCSHFEGKRELASISELSLLHSYKVEAARYILSHEPKRLGTFEDLTADNEKLLKLLQDIDLGKVQNIRSKIQRKHEGDLPYIEVGKAKPLEFSEWQSLLPEILAAYQRGEHVFIHQNSFFTIWGLELSKEMISSEIIKNYEGNSNAEILVNFYRKGRLPGNFGNRHKLLAAYRNKITPFLDEELKTFYLRLLKSEARHYEDYLSLARTVAESNPKEKKLFDSRVKEIGELEAELILSADNQFRFHSGMPT